MTHAAPATGREALAEIGVAHLEEMLAIELSDGAGPGAAVGLYRDGALVAHATRGLASLEYGLPITAETVFDIASVSKQMTAACAASLAREGLVDLDADLRELIPELKWPGITLRRCLQHVTGLRDYMAVTALRGLSYGEMKGEAYFMEWLAGTDGLDFEPGTDASYSNSGYVATAAALSRAAGKPFGELMAERVFEPLGMTVSTLHDVSGKVVPGMAFSYYPHGEGYLREEMPEEQVGDGAVLTTVGELAAWQGFLLDGRGLGTDIRNELLTSGVLADGRPTEYGLGVFLSRLDGRETVEHSGGMYSFRSYLIACPETGWGVTVLSNHGRLSTNRLAHRILRASQPQAYTPARAAASTAGDPKSNTAPAPVLPAGRWLSLGDGAKITVVTRPDGTGELQHSGEEGDQLRYSPENGWTDEDGEVWVTASVDRLIVTGELGHRLVCAPLSEPGVTEPAPLPRGEFRSTDLGSGAVIDHPSGAALVLRGHTFPLRYRGTVGGESDAYAAIDWYTTAPDDDEPQVASRDSDAPNAYAQTPRLGEVTIAHDRRTSRVTVHVFGCTFGPYELGG